MRDETGLPDMRLTQINGDTKTIGSAHSHYDHMLVLNDQDTIVKQIVVIQRKTTEPIRGLLLLNKERQIIAKIGRAVPEISNEPGSVPGGFLMYNLK